MLILMYEGINGAYHLVAINGTTNRVPYHLGQVTATQMKVGHQ